MLRRRMLVMGSVVALDLPMDGGDSMAKHRGFQLLNINEGWIKTYSWILNLSLTSKNSGYKEFDLIQSAKKRSKSIPAAKIES